MVCSLRIVVATSWVWKRHSNSIEVVEVIVPSGFRPMSFFPRGLFSYRLAVLLGLLILTAWNVTRSNAFNEAEQAYQRATSPPDLANVLRLALAHLDRRPWSREAALLAARCLSRLDFPDGAEPYYQRAGLLSRDDLLLRAYAILRSNQRDKAIAAYREILARWPDDLTALRLLAGIYYVRRQYEDALTQARKLASIPGGEVEGHRLAGTIFHDTNSPEAAISEFLAVLRETPDLQKVTPEGRPVFWNYLASDLLALGRASEAQGYLNHALSDNPSDSVLRTLLGKAYFQLGQFDRAEDCWRQVLASDPRFAAASLELGRLLLARNRPEEAVEALKRASEAAPGDYEVHYSLTLAYRRLGLRDLEQQAREHAERIRGLTPPPSKGMGASNAPGVSMPPPP